MKLSTRARYALRMMLELARSEAAAPLSLGAISRRTSVSRRYLDQLATAMKSAGLVTARPGRGGGYGLAKPAAEIRLGAIIEAAIGPINIVDCVLEPRTCLKSAVCECRDVYALINRRIAEVFDAFSLADLADRATLRRLVADIENGAS